MKLFLALALLATLHAMSNRHRLQSHGHMGSKNSGSGNNGLPDGYESGDGYLTDHLNDIQEKIDQSPTLMKQMQNGLVCMPDPNYPLGPYPPVWNSNDPTYFYPTDDPWPHFFNTWYDVGNNDTMSDEWDWIYDYNYSWIANGPRQWIQNANGPNYVIEPTFDCMCDWVNSLNDMAYTGQYTVQDMESYLRNQCETLGMTIEDTNKYCVPPSEGGESMWFRQYNFMRLINMNEAFYKLCACEPFAVRGHCQTVVFNEEGSYYTT